MLEITPYLVLDLAYGLAPPSLQEIAPYLVPYLAYGLTPLVDIPQSSYLQIITICPNT